MSTYKDLKKEMSIEQIIEKFEKKNLELKNLLELIEQSANNRDRKFIDFRILSATIKELQKISINELHNESLALSTRNIFELNMIYQYTCLSDVNLQEWKGNSVYDEIEIFQGILKLSENPNHESRKIIQSRIDTLKATVQNKNIKISKQLNTKNLAEKVGLVNEYEGLFKLYSKFIHPTSYLLNSNPEDINSLQYKNIFLMQLQIYLSDLETKLRDFYTTS